MLKATLIIYFAIITFALIEAHARRHRGVLVRVPVTRSWRE
jgi:hypothetical protein